MGNHKFKISHMLPHAWFYKLKNMTPTKLRNLNSMHKSSNNNKRFHPKTKSTTSFTSSVAIAPPENSCQTHHFHEEVNNVPPSSHHLSEAPRKITKKRGSTKKRRASYVTSSASSENVLTAEKYLSYSADASSFDYSGLSDLDSEFERQKVDSRFKCKARDNKPIFKKEFGLVSEFELKPIITKKSDNKGDDYGIGAAKKFHKNKEESSCHVRKATANSPGVKLRTNSPRVGTKRVGQVHGSKSVSSDGQKSVASEMKNVIVVKDSFAPNIDLKESILEMILENNIRTLEGLEILLVCYLSLNSSAYHNLIVKLFEQIWFEIADIY